MTAQTAQAAPAAQGSEDRPATRAPHGPQPRIAVVMVNWNGWSDTIAAHRSLLESLYAGWHLFVVDNASTDDSVARLSALGPGATLIRHDRNAGFAGGSNVGIRAALAWDADYVFLLNNDAVVEHDTLDVLIAAATRAPDDVLGCVVRFKPSDALQFFGSHASPYSGASVWFEAAGDLWRLEQPTIESDFILGAALFAPARLFRDIGLMDERFFLTYEEVDWCYRARAAGSACRVVTAAKVGHLGSASMGASDAPLQAYFLQRNRLLFQERHGGVVFRLRGLRTAVAAVVRGLGSDLVHRPHGSRFGATRRARLMGLRDYVLRRFGDCPEAVRRLARS